MSKKKIGWRDGKEGFMSSLHVHPEQTNKRKKKVLFFLSLFIVLVLIFVVAGVFTFQSYNKKALQPVNPKSKQQELIEIKQGASAADIAKILDEKGLIQDEKAFRYYVKKEDIHSLQAGTYQISKSMSVQEIVDKLSKGEIFQTNVKVVIPEGKRLVEIADILAKKTAIPKEKWIQTMDDPIFIQALMKKYPNILTEEILKKEIKHPLEGYLFPATYEWDLTKMNEKDIVEELVRTTSLYMKKYEAQFEQSSLSRHQIFTLASIIERESKTTADRFKVSGVFYNRIAQNMPIQSDVTVLYALDDHRVQVTYEDLKTKSPYNTYTNPGLPIGPIDSPGEESIKAALLPEKSEYLFFYARPNGEVLYTKTYEEHDAVYKQYKSEWAELK